jgi:hypothetical protein
VKVDPTVQVAAFGIVATVISTAGVVIVAIINKASPTAVKPVNIENVNPEDVPDSEWAKIVFRKETAIKRREETIAQLKALNEDLIAENEELRAQRDYCLRNHE